MNTPPTSAPRPGEVQAVAPGVLWIRLPLPIRLNHINLWAIQDRTPDGREGWAVVDTGMQTLESAAAWKTLLAEGGPLGGRPLTRVFITHMHPDHIGMAGWLTRRNQCRLWITRLEYLTCRALTADTGRQAPDDAIEFYRRAGWTEDHLEDYRARFGGFGKMIHALPDSFRRLRDGELITIGDHDWRVVVGNGHSPEHACLHCPDLQLLVSGDQVLPKISSNVSVFPMEPDGDPLGDWLASLRKIRAEVPDDVVVLPAHNEPFRGLHARLDTLTGGHERSLVRLRERLAVPQRVIDVFDVLFARPVFDDPHLLSLATGESLAHLNHLIRRGQASVSMVDGICWYRALA